MRLVEESVYGFNMAKRTFTCKCGYTCQKYTNKKTIPCPDCNSDIAASMPNLNGPATVNEKINDLGTRWKQDQKTLVKERNEEYYWRVEVPRMVESGQYGIDTMLELGWIWLDDNNKIHIHKKPPHKR